MAMAGNEENELYSVEPIKVDFFGKKTKFNLVPDFHQQFVVSCMPCMA
jgi:hypothetical protein